MQIGQPNDPPITGVIVRNHTSAGTGDDAVAFFNVVGGEVSGCHINDSFARGILLYKSTATLRDNVLVRDPVFHDQGPDDDEQAEGATPAARAKNDDTQASSSSGGGGSSLAVSQAVPAPLGYEPIPELSDEFSASTFLGKLCP